MINDIDCDFSIPLAPTKHDQAAIYHALAVQFQLARIAGNVHRLLYSAEAARTSTAQYALNKVQCEEELENWRIHFMPYFPKNGTLANDQVAALNLQPSYKRNHQTYMYLLCNVKRAVPSAHRLPDGKIIQGPDPEAVDIAMSMIRIVGQEEHWINSASW